VRAEDGWGLLINLMKSYLTLRKNGGKSKHRLQLLRCSSAAIMDMRAKSGFGEASVGAVFP
jgi:hypothetical protein